MVDLQVINVTNTGTNFDHERAKEILPALKMLLNLN
jgi:hypothetical protein